MVISNLSYLTEVSEEIALVNGSRGFALAVASAGAVAIGRYTYTNSSVSTSAVAGLFSQSYAGSISQAQ
jgi:hypothetical protein